MKLNLFATAPKGLELLLVDELKQLGASSAAEKLAGVAFEADIQVAYKACLWSRLANRILLPLNKFAAETPEELYAGVQAIAWDEHFSVDKTIAVHCVCSNSKINHSLFAAQKVKDAIVDQFRAKYDARPNVKKQQPDISISVYLQRDQATVYLDLSGDSLHKRAYRSATGVAPLKENLAAAILLRSNWPAIAKQHGSLFDPMCGSGTLLIESAMIAGDIAPGLQRSYFGFLAWKQHKQKLWEELLREAQERRTAGMKNIPDIVGYDHDKHAIKIAFENIENANLLGKIHVEKKEISSFTPKETSQPGLVVVNPPYGERMSDLPDLAPLYTALGDQLKKNFTGWKAAVFTANPELGKEMGLRSHKSYAFFNGALPCKLFLFDVESNYFVDRSATGENARRIRAAKKTITTSSNPAFEMFLNRLKKNYRHLSRVAKRSGADHFRVYDADLPDYAFAIDIFPDKVEVSEYAAPSEIDKAKVERRKQEVLASLPDVLGVAPETIYYKFIPKREAKR